MKKYLLVASLLASICLNSQELNEQAVRQIVDSTRKELRNAKGNKRIDCLNLLAESYFWIWDENDKHLDTACTYSEESYKLAKNSGYKKGLGYALLWKSHCYGGRTDNNNKNNDTETNYLETYNYAHKAIQIGEELKDYRLVGDVYNTLKWLERWKGDLQVKFRSHLEKAIYYYEKPITGKITGHLSISNCDQCRGNEEELGSLYLQLGGLDTNFTTRQSIFEKSIYYFQKSRDRSGLADAYLALGNMIISNGDLESSINNFNKALSLFSDIKNEYGEARVYEAICRTYFNCGDFEKGIEYSKKNIALAEKIARANGRMGEKDYHLYQAYYWMGRFYSIADDMEMAFLYLRKSYNYANEPWIQNCKTAMAEFHRWMGNYDSSMYYLSFRLNNPIGIGSRILSGLYISQKQYDKALDLINLLLKGAKDRNDLFNQGKLYTNLAKAFYGKNDYANALTNAKEGLSILNKVSLKYSLVENYQLLSDIFYKMGKYDSAFYYLKIYTESKDALLKKQLYIKLNDYKKEAEELKRTGQIKLLQKDNLIKEQQLQEELLLKQQSESQLALLDKTNQLKDQQLKEEGLIKEQNRSQLTLLNNENKLKDQQLKQQAFLRNALIAGLFLLSLLGIFIIRNIYLKRKNAKLQLEQKEQEWQVKQLQSENKHVELEKQAAALEMQALRAQMNPHFIFNCLSSINRFILKNEGKTASNYLTRFSRLMRMVLNNSQKPFISLDDELEMLELYLEMERLRFKNSFDYGITFLNTVDSDNIFIPPLLLQPFCENAIWHGLMNKEGQGRLDIELSMEHHILNCVMRDNGVGREKAEELKSKTAEKEKSMGLKITTERLALLNREKELHTFYDIEDLKDENGNAIGTKVTLKISYKHTVEEYA